MLSTSAPPSSVALRAELVREYVAYMRFEQHLSKYTVRNYEHDLAKFDRFLPPEKRYQDVDRPNLRAFLGHLHDRGFAIATIRRVMACLRSFYKFLRLEGHIEHSPVDDMPRMRVPAVLR